MTCRDVGSASPIRRHVAHDWRAPGHLDDFIQLRAAYRNAESARGQMLRARPILRVRRSSITCCSSHTPSGLLGPRHVASRGHVVTAQRDSTIRLSDHGSCFSRRYLTLLSPLLTRKKERATRCRRGRRPGARRTPTRFACWERSARRSHGEDRRARQRSAL